MAPSAHDSIVKLAFSNPKEAAAELRLVLPEELASVVDWTTLAVEPRSFVNRALDKSHSGILYSVLLAGEAAYLYVLRVLDMHVKRFGARLPLPPVVAVVLHHTNEGWRGATDLLSLFGDLPNRVPGLKAYLPQLRFRVDDIGHLSDDGE